MKIKIFEQMENFGYEGQNPYILEFVIPREKNDAPHLKAKKSKMRFLIGGLLIFSLFPN